MCGPGGRGSSVPATYNRKVPTALVRLVVALALAMAQTTAAGPVGLRAGDATSERVVLKAARALSTIVAGPARAKSGGVRVLAATVGTTSWLAPVVETALLVVPDRAGAIRGVELQQRPARAPPRA